MPNLTKTGDAPTIFNNARVIPSETSPDKVSKTPPGDCCLRESCRDQILSWRRVHRNRTQTSRNINTTGIRVLLQETITIRVSIPETSDAEIQNACHCCKFGIAYCKSRQQMLSVTPPFDRTDSPETQNAAWYVKIRAPSNGKS